MTENHRVWWLARGRYRLQCNDVVGVWGALRAEAVSEGIVRILETGRNHVIIIESGVGRFSGKNCGKDRLLR